jgi:predicted RNA methylase
VECTRDALADRIGRDVAAAAARLPSLPPIVVDPSAGSCNTLYWMLRHLPGSEGIACELDAQVHALTRRNLDALTGPRIELVQGDFQELLSSRRLPPERSLVVFVAPPWGAALDETAGLDLRRTAPPVASILRQFAARFVERAMLFAVQVYERVEAGSLAELRSLFGWSGLHAYELDAKGRNHGLLLGTIAGSPPAPLTSRRAARGKG